jgi:hypothetical protein
MDKQILDLEAKVFDLTAENDRLRCEGVLMALQSDRLDHELKGRLTLEVEIQRLTEEVSDFNYTQLKKWEHLVDEIRTLKKVNNDQRTEIFILEQDSKRLRTECYNLEREKSELEQDCDDYRNGIYEDKEQ